MIEQVEAVLGLQPPRLGAHLEDADRRRVVDEDARLGERAERVRQPAVVLLAQEPTAEPVRIDAGLGRQHAHEQLLFRHLEAEEADRHVGRRADVERDVEHEARLPHRRPRRDEHEVGRLEAGGHLVEIDETGRHAGDQALVLLQLLDRREAALHEIAQRDEAGADAIFGDGKDRALGLVEQQVRLLLGFVGLGEDLVGRVDQVAERRLLFDDARVVLDVGRARHAVGQRRDVGRAADLVELAACGTAPLCSVTKSMGSLRSLSATMLLKMRRCASRKKSRASMSSAAWLKASLWIRIAPRTDFSASRLCGSVRSAATSGIGGIGARIPDSPSRGDRPRHARSITRSAIRSTSEARQRCAATIGHLDLRGHVAMDLDGTVTSPSALSGSGR